MRYNKLTPTEEAVILHKATEPPFTGKYLNNKLDGTYSCKQCDTPLFRSNDKFESGCGWVSFDDEIEGAVLRVPDADGRRTEIVCAKCGGHLGHVFSGEGFTAKNIRHCVNSVSINFEEKKDSEQKLDSAYFASGCFWGTQYHFMKATGVIKTYVGYMGGDIENPTYEEVCSGNTGHLETVKVLFDTNKTDFKSLLKLFFETHNFTQKDGQGPDIGSQYLSAVFCKNSNEKEIVIKLLNKLKEMGYEPATTIKDANKTTFWEAENYHQEYYKKKNDVPYCHVYRKIF